MYADPYLITIVSRTETQQQTERLERARIAREQTERLVPRRRRVKRMLRRVVLMRRRPAAEAA